MPPRPISSSSRYPARTEPIGSSGTAIAFRDPKAARNDTWWHTSIPGGRPAARTNPRSQPGTGKSVSRGGAEEPMLRVRSGTHAGRTIVIVGAIVVGREADIDLGDEEISRRHARIRREGDRVAIEDLGSSNGTWVNNRRVTQAALEPGDVV